MSNILIGITGSIAAYKMGEVVSQLTQAGHRCRVMMTGSAMNFVGPATFEGLSGESVLTDTFSPDHMMSHIHWARWADLFLIAPATANQVNKLAVGIGDDIISTTYLGFENSKPIIIAPAMNTVMYNHPTVQKSLRLLKETGAIILKSKPGPLACGEFGDGRMPEPREIIVKIEELLKTSKVEEALKTPTESKKQFLVTFGGTKEIIDGVRFIQNLSTGRTGLKIALSLVDMGHEVSLLAALNTKSEVTKYNHLFKQVIYFENHSDLERRELDLISKTNLDWVLHLAAVSDYSVAKISSDAGDFAPSKDLKLPSDQAYSLHLKINEKVVNKIKRNSLNPNCKVVAFKLTNSKDDKSKEAAIEKLLHSDGIDFVVHNDLHEIDLESGRHPFYLYDRNGLKENVSDAMALTRRLNSLSNGVHHDTLS